MPERQVGGQCLITQRADFLMTPLCLARPCSMMRPPLRTGWPGRSSAPRILPVAGVYTCRRRSKGTRSPRANDSALPDRVSRVTRVRGSRRGEPFSSSSTRWECACVVVSWTRVWVSCPPYSAHVLHLSLFPPSISFLEIRGGKMRRGRRGRMKGARSGSVRWILVDERNEDGFIRLGDTFSPTIRYFLPPKRNKEFFFFGIEGEKGKIF